jgi:hypothetical protein
MLKINGGGDPRHSASATDRKSVKAGRFDRESV